MTLGLSPEAILERNAEKRRVWRLEHPDKVRAFHKKHNALPHVSTRKTEWARQHREEINNRRREQYSQKKTQEATTEHLESPPQPTTSTDDEENIFIEETSTDAVSVEPVHS